MKPELKRILCLAIELLIASYTITQGQCSEFYGMTVKGGEYNIGTIFKTDNNGENYASVYDRKIIAPGINPCGELCKANNNKYYGLTSYGGKYDNGVLFEWDPVTNSYIKKLDFKDTMTGKSPMGALIQADNGKLYGITFYGGINEKGVLFEWDPNNDIYTKKIDFNGKINGSNPRGSLMQARNGKLFGMTGDGGANNNGVLFEYDITTDTYSKKFDFGGENGRWPYGSLIEDSNGKFYGMTENGGLNDNGVIFEWDSDTGVFSKKFDFNDTCSGSYPYGSLILAENGKLFGMTEGGGAYDKGIIFEWDPVSDVYIKKIDFDGKEKGCNPLGSLVQADNGNFYGTTHDGGLNNAGVLFEWNPANNKFVKKIDFDDKKNGYSPVGILKLSDNNKFYVTASGGGPSGAGILMEYDPDTDTIIIKVNFNWTIDGEGAWGDLTQANNGKIYGLSYLGGKYNQGILFEWDPIGHKFTNKHDFDGINGGRPLRNSLVQADNGKLYGLTNGGFYDKGVLFEWDILRETYTKKLDFNGSKNGAGPTGGLISAENGKLYGTTISGGMNDGGVLFEWDPVNETYTKKIESFKIGGLPTGSLLQANNGKFYGTTAYGASNYSGTLFEWDPVTNTITKSIGLKGFEHNNILRGPLIQSDNGKLYGVTSEGGSYNSGIIFEWDLMTDNYIVKFNFNTEKGKGPGSSLLRANNGKLYGVTNTGGLYNKGVLFEWDPITEIYTKKLNFNYERLVYSSLIEINNNLSAISVETCRIYSSPSGKYTWTISGIYKDTIPSATGRDSIITVYLKINHSTSDTINLIACNSYISPSRKYNWISSGTYLDTIPNASGCDSIITLNLTVHKSSSSTLNEMACDKYNFNGKILTSSGTYYDTIPNAAGCDSMITLNLTMHQSSVRTLIVSACSEYNFNGRILNASGTYADRVTNAAGCDSIIVLYLTILRPTYHNLNITACDQYFFGDELRTGSGVYQETLPNSVGCDSVIILNLGIIKSTTSTISAEACNTYASPSGNYTWTSSGTYTDTMPNSAGCDSVITINLTVNHSTSSIINSTSCNGYFSPSGRYTWTADGTYLDTIPNAAGCDSIITVNLAIGRSTSFIQQSACDTYTSPSGRYTWTSSGTYLDTIPNAAGCDSLITINLQIDHVDTTIIQDRTVLISNDRNASHQWIDCGNGNALIEGETYLTFTSTANGSYAVIVSNGACVDTSSCYDIMVTGITELSDNNITLYPNPTNGSFTIDLGRVCVEAVVTINAPDGQTIQRKHARNAQTIELDLNAPPGLYMVTITAENKYTIKKLVKN